MLFNSWKHHTGWLRHRIAEATAQGPSALDLLAENLVVVGSGLMDLYLGSLTPSEIGLQVLRVVQSQAAGDLEGYRRFIAKGSNYQMMAFPEDDSRWCLRVGDETGRYVHVHPGRDTPHTRRVRANVLKTAVMTLAHVGVHGGDPLEREVVNQVRQRHLKLGPVGRDLASDLGVGSLIDLLRGGGTSAGGND